MSDFLIPTKPVDETKNYFTTSERTPDSWGMKDGGKVLHLTDKSGSMCGAAAPYRFFPYEGARLTREHNVFGRPICKRCMRKLGWTL